ncbi:MAG: glycosyltransferase [Candidatus Nanohalobium sp.]
MELAVVYPVFNEREYLETAVERTLEQDVEASMRVVFVSDGSTDGTQDEADRLEEEYEEVTHLTYDERLGKGKAFEKAFFELEADVYGYCDVDLSTDPREIPAAVDRIREGADIVTGNRYLEGENTRRLKRGLPSHAFNLMLKTLFSTEISDHQCGFKFLSSDVRPLLESVRSNHFFWDAELLIRAQREGLSIRQLPVRWTEKDGSKVSLFRDSMYFMRRAFQLRIELWRE